MHILQYCILLGIFQASSSLIDCDDVLKESSSFIGECNNKWSNLKSLVKPTQKQVGYAWIKYKLDKDFTSSSNAQAAIDDSVVPAVIAPDNKFYFVDDHHTLCALDYSGYDSTVTLNVICDQRNLNNMSEFWSFMKEESLVYLGAHPNDMENELPVAIDTSALPTYFSFTSSNKAFSNDPWRSVAGYSRKVENVDGLDSCPSDGSKYCHRCFVRGCINGYQAEGAGIPYYEFRWAYYMLDASFYKTTLYWPSTSDWKAFYDTYNELQSSTKDSIDKVNPEKWLNLASLVIPLCRNDATATYYPPSSLYPTDDTAGKLPGYMIGIDVELQDDPNCDSPACSTRY